MILFIILGIVLAVALAIIVVKFVPIKLTPLVSLALLGVAAFLGFKIYSGIMEPIKFHEEKKVRFAKVIKNMKMIADAQDAHSTITGKFNKSGEDLIKFIDTAKFPIVDTRTIVVQENRGTTWNKLMVEVEKKVTDTIGYELVKNKIFKGRDYHQMLEIPYTNGEKFKIETSAILRSNKILASVFETKIKKSLVLQGLSKSLIKQEDEALGGEDIAGRYISVGSLSEVSVNGNWPPLFDQLSELQ